MAQVFVRFWEGERDREKLLHGIEAARDRALVNYVYDTYFAPLLNRKSGGLEAEVEAYYRGPKHVALRRIVQLTSDKTWNNGRMRFGDGGVYSERQKVISDWLPGIESDGYHITAKIVSLWNDERDPQTLFGGLDQKSELLMRKLWRYVTHMYPPPHMTHMYPPPSELLMCKLWRCVSLVGLFCSLIVYL